jgi:hypothetical protein
MRLFECDTTLIWGGLDLPMMGMNKDWDGLELRPPLGFTIASDSSNLWFVSARQAPATCHPRSEPGRFLEGLWECDVAELFLADPRSGAYLEFNLAPNGAWWAAKFNAPRARTQIQPDFPSIITSHASDFSDETWCSAISIPLPFLEQEIRFGVDTTANATAILNSPLQTFHSAQKLPGTVPDFHQPASFPLLSRTRQ